MPQHDLSAYLADDFLELTGVVSEKHPDGKTYRIKSPSGRLGLQLHRMLQVWGARDKTTAPSKEDLEELVSITTGDDGERVDLQVKLMGSTYEEMLDDGVSAEAMEKIQTVVMTHYGYGSEFAKQLVAAAGEAPARPNRATRRTTTKRTVKRTAGSKSTATGAGTRSAKATGSTTTGLSSSQPGEQAKAV